MVTDGNWSFCSDHFTMYKILSHYVVHLKSEYYCVNYNKNWKNEYSCWLRERGR